MADQAMMRRGYAVLDIKAVDDERREIEGIATTPATDRMLDIVEPLGARFTLPLPFLWQHQASAPVGNLVSAKPGKAGIPFKAKIPFLDEPGRLKDRLDEAWQSVKLGLVRAVSIGFRILKYEVMETGGWRITEWEWLELSLVTIPANADATITNIKSIDAELRASLRPETRGAVVHIPAQVPHADAPKTRLAKGATMPKTIAEQISDWEDTREAKAAALHGLMTKAMDEGVTLSPEEAEQYDGLKDEVKSIDQHLGRLREMQTLNLTKAVAVVGQTSGEADATRSAQSAPETPRYPSIQVAPATKLAPGIKFARYVLCLARAQGNIMQALEMAKANDQWRVESPEVEAVLKSAVSAGSTTDSTWAGALSQYQDMAADFAAYLRPKTILGKLNLRKVPFKTRIARQTGGASVNWVGEGKVKPLTSGAFDTVTLDFAKIAGIVVLTDEIIKLSNPQADELVRDDLAAAITQFMDAQFLDPSKTANDVSPASVTNGVTAIDASGQTEAALRSDVRRLMQTFLDADLGLGDAVWIMSEQMALSIGMMQTALSADSFPGLSVNGGTFMKLPVITSENVPATGGSPTDGSMIALVKQSEVLLADDGNVTIDASREASLQMDSTPDSPATASTVTISMFQHNMTAIRAERYVTWKKRRDAAVGYIQYAKYAE